ncbi:MAG: Omp28-related outer membrane protein [bacterium]|nr:Omp28-related outer membrane protein [bacterium]
MKKRQLLLISIFGLTLNAFAQLPVSQTPGNRQALVEEFTGHTCQYCPDGHKKVDELIVAQAGKVYGINIHTGGYAGTGTYPQDFRTTDGDAIAAIPTQLIAGYPAGSVNRVPATTPQKAGGMAMSRGSFASASADVYNQSSYVNIAGQATINVATRELTINIEAYYTANGPASNKLSVMLIQDKIMGPQTGGSTWYPAMMVGANYTHNKVLRDVITTGATGELMAGPTTSGTKFTKTITYTIPAIIKNLDVVLSDISLIAFVSETDKDIIAVNKVPISGLPLAVNEVNSAFKSMSVYPNPVSNFANVDFTLAEPNNISVTVLNLLGQTVISNEMNNLRAGDHNFPLDVTNLQSGVYFVKISDGTNSMVKKINVSK